MFFSRICEQPQGRETWGCSDPGDQAGVVYLAKALLASKGVLRRFLRMVLTAQGGQVLPLVPAFWGLGQRLDVIHFLSGPAASDAFVLRLADRVDLQVGITQAAPAAVTAWVSRALPSGTALAGLAFGGWLAAPVTDARWSGWH
jgi:hypothetical protein